MSSLQCTSVSDYPSEWLLTFTVLAYTCAFDSQIGMAMYCSSISHEEHSESVYIIFVTAITS